MPAKVEQQGKGKAKIETMETGRQNGLERPSGESENEKSGKILQ